MNVLGRVVPHALEIGALKEVERLEENRALPPETRLEDRKHAVACLERCLRRALDTAAVSTEVSGREEPTGALDRLGDSLADVAAIEAIARGIDRRLASLIQPPLFLLCECSKLTIGHVRVHSLQALSFLFDIDIPHGEGNHT